MVTLYKRVMRKINAPYIAKLLHIPIEDAIQLDDYLYTEIHINWIITDEEYIHYAKQIGIELPVEL